MDLRQLSPLSSTPSFRRFWLGYLHLHRLLDSVLSFPRDEHAAFLSRTSLLLLLLRPLMKHRAIISERMNMSMTTRTRSTESFHYRLLVAHATTTATLIHLHGRYVMMSMLQSLNLIFHHLRVDIILMRILLGN
jgi:hypothetical protein